jgi:hypothetical protein
MSVGDFSAEPLAAEAATLRDRVGAWLRHANIQARCGGVAGRLRRDGQPAYIYGEVTGYWLRWASLYAPDPVRMSAAVEFLGRSWADGAPMTRIGAQHDWRNHAVFSFDLAMMVRGLADAAPIVGEARCVAAAARLWPLLQRLIAPDGLLAAVLTDDPAVLPVRWSTHPGPFQAKTAAALLSAPWGWLPHDLDAACQHTLRRWRDKASDHGHLHARFYALEGVACSGESIDPAAVLADRRADGAWPEEAAHPGRSPRADVQAQGLRLLCLTPEPAPQLESALQALARHVCVDGSVAFRTGDTDANIWCALFAHQALDWCEGLQTGRRPQAAAII